MGARPFIMLLVLGIGWLVVVGCGGGTGGETGGDARGYPPAASQRTESSASLSAPEPDPAWEAAFTRTEGWTGADGAASIMLPGGRVLWLWGDTWIGPVREGRHAEGSVMVNNTIAVHHARADRAPGMEEVSFYWGGDGRGAVAAWAAPAAKPDGSKEWYWPAGGGIVAPGPGGAERLLVFMTRLGRIDDSDSMWNFRPLGTTLIVVDNPGAEPDRWKLGQREIAALEEGGGGGRQVTWGTAVIDDGDGGLYVYGLDQTNVLNKKVLLARVASGEIERFGAWRFWDGREWTAWASSATAIATHAASEVSVHRMGVGGRWVMVYSELTLGPRVLCRTAPAAEGPWSEAFEVYACPEPGLDKRMLVYSAKAHPELSRPGELLISYCVNSTDFWHVAANAHVYRPRFVRVPLSRIFGKGPGAAQGEAGR